MTFIEVHIQEDELELEKLIKESYVPTHGETAPEVRLGRAILWERRTFRELRFPSDPQPLVQEDAIFRNIGIPRTRILLGSFQGEVFTSPPAAGSEQAARVKEGGRCGREYVVKPFRFCDYEG